MRLVADQPVVKHNVGLLHQAKRAEGQKVGIARPGANQVDLANRWFVTVCCGFIQQADHQRLCLFKLAGIDVLRDGPVNHGFPETPPPRAVGNSFLDLVTVAPGEFGQAAICRRDRRLEPGLEHPGQQWRGPATGDCHQQG